MYTPSSTAFLRPTRGGGFKYVEYDDNAFHYPQTIGSTASSISGLGPADENMLKTIFIMPNKSTNPDATLMIVVDEIDPPTNPKTYQYVYVGNINDLPSDVLTESSIVNDLSTGGTDKPLSAEQGRTLNSHVNYTTCGSGAGDQVKLISDDGFELSTHLRLLVMMTNTNTNSTPRFNINNTGVKDVWYNGSVASDTNTWGAGEVVDVYYDGTKYIANTHGGAQFSTGEKVGDVGVDDEPTAESDNLVKGGGIYKQGCALVKSVSITQNGYYPIDSLTPKVMFVITPNQDYNRLRVRLATNQAAEYITRSLYDGTAQLGKEIVLSVTLESTEKYIQVYTTEGYNLQLKVYDAEIVQFLYNNSLPKLGLPTQIDNVVTPDSTKFISSGAVDMGIKNAIKREFSVYTTGYIPGFSKRLKELYLTGLNPEHIYYINHCYYNGGISFTIKDYSASGIVVCRNVSGYSSGIVPLYGPDNSGISGYALLNITSSDTDDISGRDELTLNNAVVSNKDFSPTIKDYLNTQELENTIIENNIPLQENIIRSESISCTGSVISNKYLLTKGRIYRFYFPANWNLDSGRKLTIQKYDVNDTAYGDDVHVNYNKDISGTIIDFTASDWYDSDNQYTYKYIKVEINGNSGQTAPYQIIDITENVKVQANIVGNVTDITPKFNELTFGSFIHKEGYIASSANYCMTTTPISINAGDALLLYNTSGGANIVFVAKKKGSQYKTILKSTTTTAGTAYYEFHEKCDIYLSYHIAKSFNCRIYRISKITSMVREDLHITPVGYPCIIHKGNIDSYCLDASNDRYSSFDISIPTNELLHMPMILNITAKYVKSSETDNYPTINIYNEVYYDQASSSIKYKSQTYRVGMENEYINKSYRIILPPPECQLIHIAINVPEGIDLFISDFSASYQQNIRVDSMPYIVDDHGITGRFCTLSNVMNSAIHGFNSCIVVPKVTSDGVWCCFHDDENINELYYPNGQVVCENNKGTYTQYDESGNVIGTGAMPVSSVTWDFLSSLVYKGTIYNNTHVMKLDDYLEVCLKTGVSPFFSVHPDIDKQAMYSILKQYGLLDRAVFLISINSLSNYYSVFGDEIGGYSLSPSAVSVQAVEAAILTLADYNTQNGKYWIECRYTDESTAHDIISTIINSTKTVDGNTVPTGIKPYMIVNGEDSEVMRKLMLWGCNRFCSDNMYSYGLNW